MSYTMTLLDGTERKVRTEQGFWKAIDVLAMAILVLPPDERRQEVAPSGSERDAVKKLVGRRIAEIIQPGRVEESCALIQIVPSFFSEYIFSQRDGSISASLIFQDAIEQELCSYVERQWDRYVERASKQSGRDITQELVPSPPPDPYVAWSESDWSTAYTAAVSPEKQVELRRNAQTRGINISSWQVADELRARFRKATQEKRYDKRFALRQEAASLGVDTSDWDHPDTTPEDPEQDVRMSVLEALEQSERPPIMAGYCQLLVSFAVQAKEREAENLEQALMGTARYWLEHCIETDVWFLEDLPKVIKNEQWMYQLKLSPFYLARVEVLSSMERLLRHHTN